MIAIPALVIKTSLLLGLAIVATVVLRRRSAAVRHWVLAVAIVCAAVVPILGWLSPSWSLPTRTVRHSTSASSVDVSVRAIGSAGAPALVDRESISPRPTTLERLGAMIVPLWLIGAALNLSVLLFGMSRLTRLSSSRAARENASIAASLTHFAGMFRVTRPVTIVRSDSHAVLVTWGMCRPKVALPADVDEWPRQRLDVVLAHELAHIARGDWLVQTVAEVCRAIYWFNPLFWIAAARLRHESERACDDAVMSAGVTGDVYATQILDIARNFGRHRQPWLPAPAMSARPSNLERRVRAMLNNRLDRNAVTRRGRWASALAVLAIAIPIATFAQGGFVTLSGTVVDPQDRLLPAATITVSDARRDVKHETKTDRNGRFELVGLPAGDYTVQAKLPGFANLTDTVTVNGQSLDRTLKMQVGELQETVTVVGDDGSVTTSRQSGNAVAKRPNPVCAPGATNGVGGNIRPPHKVKDVRPGYPGVSGDVQLLATIGTDGSVTDLQIVKADRPELAPAAIDAVRQWEFDSTLLNCVPIEVQMNVSISFRHNP